MAFSVNVKYHWLLEIVDKLENGTAVALFFIKILVLANGARCEWL